ncbi:MarR family winged helix-turn-helix transcriptional regulator [Candidatus Enterococcus mansonii]|uniref:HTH marR-type domain-containing protein n=1 Tax=Candidatus Enterococcus mansonii TaxID=1834181 RepID=A0A242C658_9ENTE|nr:MarR family winged helix-turn-helix transcriptional regulator [Enterococcus sp. 4G2_DIV0659]OTO05666.1 hypothetical protein A5880_002841 [Enterococcus sp. 4G2_DIV0659]
MKQSVGRLVSILYRKNVVYMNGFLKEFGLTSSEQPILMYLYRYDGVTQEAISNYLNIDKGAMARSIQTLEEKGYIQKKKSERDKRCNIVTLTKKARAIEREIKSKLQAWSDFLTEDLDQETETILFSALEQMVQKLETKEASVRS